jgi:hypothetical protein
MSGVSRDISIKYRPGPWIGDPTAGHGHVLGELPANFAAATVITWPAVGIG